MKTTVRLNAEGLLERTVTFPYYLKTIHEILDRDVNKDLRPHSTSYITKRILDHNEDTVKVLTEWFATHNITLGKDNANVVWDFDFETYSTKTAIIFTLPEEIATLFTLTFGQRVT